MSKRVFITATGTDAGKTFITTTLCKQLLKKKFTVEAIKPIITGYDASKKIESDAGLLLKALGKNVTDEAINSVSLFRFKAALSPDMAARREQKEINRKELFAFCEKERTANILLIEGAGGIMSPLADTLLNVDLIKKLGCPAILVTGTYLGSISHTLSALHVMEGEKVPLLALILNESKDSPVSIGDTYESLRRFIHADIPLFSVPRTKGDDMDAIPDMTPVFS